MPLKFIAMPHRDSADLYPATVAMYDTEMTAAPGLGYSIARGWRSLDELFTMIRAALSGVNDCMSELEVYAHGNPTICDGIGIANAPAFGAQLRSVTLCDRVDIYLTGCNTGVRMATTESLAQVVSRNTPTQAVDNVRVYVHGSVGYLSGTHMQGNSAATRSGIVKKTYEPYPPVEVGGVRYEGSTAATGAASYRAFLEGALA